MSGASTLRAFQMAMNIFTMPWPTCGIELRILGLKPWIKSRIVRHASTHQCWKPPVLEPPAARTACSGARPSPGPPVRPPARSLEPFVPRVLGPTRCQNRSFWRPPAARTHYSEARPPPELALLEPARRQNCPFWKPPAANAARSESRTQRRFSNIHILARKFVRR